MQAKCQMEKQNKIHIVETSNVYVALEARLFIVSLKSPSNFEVRISLLEEYLFLTACCLAFSMLWTSSAILYVQGKMSSLEYVE